MNNINWSEIENDFIAGWKSWCRFGYLDVKTCLDENGKRYSFEFRDGYAAAARENDIGGDRPRVSEAAEYAEYYVERLKADALSAYAANAD